MADRYWLPMSLPCPMYCVGSWFSQNTARRSSRLTCSGSNATSTASVWPVIDVHVSWYVGFGVCPPEYPTAVVYPPGTCQNSRSAPQKQPIPTIRVSIPSGQGPRIGVPSTACVSRTGMAVSRPGRHCSGGGGGAGSRYDNGGLLDQAVPGGRRWWALFLLTN